MINQITDAVLQSTIRNIWAANPETKSFGPPRLRKLLLEQHADWQIAEKRIRRVRQELLSEQGGLGDPGVVVTAGEIYPSDEELKAGIRAVWASAPDGMDAKTARKHFWEWNTFITLKDWHPEWYRSEPYPDDFNPGRIRMLRREMRKEEGDEYDSDEEADERWKGMKRMTKAELAKGRERTVGILLSVLPVKMEEDGKEYRWFPGHDFKVETGRQFRKDSSGEWRFESSYPVP